MRTRPMALVAAAVFLSACYHATIDTGRAPSGQVIEKKWANSFIYGLVPPPVLETAQKCPNGVAKVETHLSFLNQFVGFLTSYIYTPMEIVVSCAGNNTASSSMLDARQDPGGVMQQAADLVHATKEPVLVRF